MKNKIAKSLLSMFLLALLVGGLSTKSLAGGGGPAPLPPYPPAAVPAR